MSLISLSNCFFKYVATKVLKRLETNRIRGSFNEAEKTLLLPVSLGVSSVSLLYVLDQHLQSRQKQDRHAGYSLHVLFIDESSFLNHDSCDDVLARLKERFPSYEHSVVSLEDYHNHAIDLGESSLDLAQVNEHINLSRAQKLNMKLSAMPSPSSRLDLINIIRQKLIRGFAQNHNCERILYGDSTTRLAEKALSETAKGRGGHLPWSTADGSACIYPMRDLLKREIIMYAETTSPALTSLIIEPKLKSPVQSFKNSTIDDLMSQYFESVEQNYPSIVANVVRTSCKLQLPPSDHGERTCNVCENPITQGTWGGEQEDLSNSPISNLSAPKSCCYGCARAFGTALD